MRKTLCEVLARHLIDFYASSNVPVMNSSSFKLNELRSPFGRSHKRNPSSNSFGGLLDDENGLYTSTSRRKTRTADLYKLLKWSIVSLLALALLFWWKYELHIELQLYSRGWIKETILPIVPTSSSTCFSPSQISSTLYNTTLASSPSYVELHAGIGMPLGRDCYDFASTIPEKPHSNMVLPQETIIHLYWRNDLLPLGPRQIALLESILYTQDERTTRIIFWTNAEFPRIVENLPSLQPLLERFPSRLQVKRVDKKELARGTPMDGSEYLELADQQAWVDGDLVRVLVLYQFGGIWIDFDTILTGKRDLRVLLEHEWVTQWDCYDKVYQPLNGAMMHFYQNSPYLCEMLYIMATSPPPTKNSVDWGSRLYSKLWRSLVSRSIKPFQVLPFCFTDGVSCRLDNRLPDPFGEKKAEKKWGKGRWEELEDKVGKVWAIHLHNRWDKGFPEGGYVDEMVLKPIRDKKEKYGL
ncbi:uncharacterized protein JCM6883_001859 [Sporobolomyces salmoneus]|uniref:uncharacterized protein n=1 Tax=Sporobolomyces salmoneus TaxID=183962 RepID=UPI00316C6065